MDNILNTYLSYLSKLNEDKNYKPNTEENTAIYNVNNDPNYADLLKDLKGIEDVNEKKKIVVKYIANEELKNSKSVKELVSKVYGINVEDIDSVKLDNGSEIFAFYDEKIGRKRLLENLDSNSLVQRLKEVQNNNEEFQSSDYKKNSGDILKDQATKNNNRQELQMIEIDDYISHPEKYSSIDKDKQEIINKVINSKDRLEIKYINVDNNVMLTKDNRIIEISKTSDGELVFDEPIKWKNNVDEMDNEEKLEDAAKTGEISETTDYNVDYSVEENDFEDEPEFVSSEEIESEINAQNLEFEESPEEIKGKIKEYYEDPNKINNIEDEKKKSFFEKMVNEVFAVRKTEYEKKKQQKKEMIYKNTNGSEGFVNLIFVSILLLFLAFVLFIGF